MSGFSAALVEALTYDFTSFPKDGEDIGGERCAGKGRIPEPSKAQLEAFYRWLPSMRAELLTDEDAEALDRNEATYKALADLCSDRPCAEELAELPPRIFFKFVGWLLRELAPKA